MKKTNNTSKFFINKVLKSLLVFIWLLPMTTNAQTVNINGTISLAAGQMANNGTMTVSVFLKNASGFTLGNHVTTITINQSQVAYSFNYPVQTPGTEVRVELSCSNSSNICEPADGGLGTTFYLQDDGSVSDQFNTLPVENLANPQNLQFPPPPSIGTLSGTVLLPAGQTANGFMDVIIDFTIEGNPGFFKREIVRIPDTGSQVAYSIDYPVPSPGTSVSLEFQCATGNSDCVPADGGLGVPFYLRDNGTISNLASTLAVENLGDPQNLQFPPTPIVTLDGIVILPAGQVAEGSMDISLTMKDENDNLLANQIVTIGFGSSARSYTFDYLEPLAGVEVSLEVECISSPVICEPADDGLETTFYLQDDGTLADSPNTLPSQNLMDPQNLQFPILSTLPVISGTIFLPMGQTADGDMDVLINFRDASFNFNITQTVTIPDNADQVSYAFNYPVTPAGSDVRLYFQCESNCEPADGGFGTILYVQDDGSILNEFNQFPIEDLADPQNLQFPPLPTVVTLTGTVLLPAGQVANGDTDVSIFFDSSGFNTTNTVTIADGTSQVAYSFNYAEPTMGSDVQLEFKCLSATSNCEPADAGLDATFYLQDDGTISTVGLPLSIDNLNNPQNLQFPSLTSATLNGTVFLPTGQVADGDTNISLILVDDSSFLAIETVTIPNLANQVGYSFDYPLPSPGTEVSLSVSCSAISNCEPFDGGFGRTFYLQDNGTLFPLFNGRPIENLGAVQDLQLPELPTVATLTGTVLLPTGQIAQGDMEVLVAFTVPEHTITVSQTVTIPDQSNQADYNFDYPVPTSSAEVRLEFRCLTSSSNCESADGGFGTRFYLQDDDTVSSNANFVLFENISDPQNLQFPNSLVFADNYEEDNSAIESSTIGANQQQDRTIHKPGDVDWVSFRVLEGDSEIVISTLAVDQFRSPLMMTLYDSNLVQIETGRENFSDAELENFALLEIDFESLTPGNYFILIEGISSITESIRYSLSLALERVEELCFPVVAANGSVAVICL